jgi:hypothetical protein
MLRSPSHRRIRRRRRPSSARSRSNESFRTYSSGLAEFVLFVAVYPATIYMVWDWWERELSDRIVTWARLPTRFVFVWLA